MTSPWYNPTFLVRNTRALAESINNELSKIRAAFDQLPAPGSVGSGANPVYTHFAYADSADGTSNFTTGAPGNRTYIGVQANVASATPSNFPADYEWTRLAGADGADGDNGQYRDFRFIRATSQPAQPSGNIPAGSSDTIPTGTDPVWVTSAVRNGADELLTAWEPYIRLSALPAATTYNAATTYTEGMQVLFGGGTYILIVPSSTGNAPSGTDQANAYWEVAAAPGGAGTPASPPSAFTSTIVLTSSTGAVNLRTLADAAGYTGLSDATITFEVPSGVTIRGTAPGGIGIDSGTWPTSSYTIALTLVVQSGGIVDGGGGNGGNGGSGASGTAGSAGGDAIYLRTPFTGGVTIDAGGTVRGGGGGGAGGKGEFYWAPEDILAGAGGGGGGGAPNGLGGSPGVTWQGSFPATAGSAGTTGGGGAGGAGEDDGVATGGAGASGGGFATAGSANAGVPGGAAGYAVRKNGNTATVTNNGTMTGTAA